MSAIRKLKVDPETCIGCQACTSVCPTALIGFSDDDNDRVFTFTETCSEDCTRCADACSEKAITLAPAKKASKKLFKAKFPLAHCASCGTPYATEKMVAKLKVSIPSLLVPEGMDWLNICPACRQKGEAQNISERGLEGRSFS
ncbi:MAG: 4Fe-4S binding protein [Desulfobacterales bacterium]|jgi:hydrogenase-4 component H